MFSFLIRIKRLLLRALKVRSESRQPRASTIKLKTIRVILIFFTACAISLIYPGKELFYPLDIPHKGEIVDDDVRAPFQIVVNKSDAELNAERQLAASAIPYPVVYDSSATHSALHEYDRFWKVSDSLKTIHGENTRGADIANFSSQLAREFPRMSDAVLRRTFEIDTKVPRMLLRTILADSIFSVGVFAENAELPDARGKIVLLRQNNRERIVSKDRLLSTAAANNKLLAIVNQLARAAGIDAEYWYLLGRSFIVSNLIPQDGEYQEKLAAELATITTVKETIESGDLILGTGSIVGEREERILGELARKQHYERLQKSWLVAAVPVLARMALVIGLFSLLYLFLRFYRRAIYSSYQKLITIYLVFSVQIALLFVLSRFTEASIYLFPVAFLPIMITILFDMEIGLVATLVLAMMLGVLERFDFTLTLMTMLVGSVACYASRYVRKRSTFFRIILFVSLSYMLFTIVVETMRVTAERDLLNDVIASALNGLICGLLAFALLPFFEALFGFATDITLLELSDPNHPLLKRLAIEAPGTYHHSLIVSNLAESAAQSIGANSLLARVGCYYHDIGKMEIPEYFVENQLSVKSKHEQLTPSMSALILTAHVKKGRILGEQSDIPDDVLNFIEEHHGTMVMTYFYDKALKMGEGETSIDKYRYPGPKPQTRETGIAMLADAVEAASRTLDDPKPARIMSLIERIINDRFESGELDECPLTLRDLAKIKHAFAQVLIGAFHHRVEYPKRDATVTA